MDKEKKAGRFDWLPAHMPGVARLIADKRAELGRDWVNLCWQRGVVEGQPGWFYAAEGGLAVGTLWVEAAQTVLELRELAGRVMAAGPALGMQPGAPDQAATLKPLLIMRPQEAGDA
jgi:hypothetical protein